MFFLNRIYGYLLNWGSGDSPTCENPHKKKNRQINVRKFKAIFSGRKKQT